MRFSLLVLFLLIQLSLHAQSFDLLQSLQIGDGEGDDDESREIAFFQNGDLLVAGQFEGLIDFDPNPNQSSLAISLENGGESYLVRYTQQGQIVWWKALRSQRSVDVYSLLIDAQENIYLTGSYIQELVFDEANPNARLSGVSPNDGDGFIVKYNSNGQYLWANQFAGTGIDAGTDLALNPQGELVVLGSFGDSLYFDPPLASSLRVSANAGDVFFAAYASSTGQFLWVQTIAGSGFDNARALAIDSLGNYYLYGDYTGTLSLRLNPLVALTSSGGNDVFIAKYDSSRQLSWAEKIAGSSTDLGADMALQGDSLLLMTGTFKGNIQLDPSGTLAPRNGSNFIEDVFLLALDTAAQYQWGHVIGGTSTDRVAGLTLANNNEVWIGGYFANTVDFDQDPNQSFSLSALGGDGFIAGYNLSSGSFVNAYQLQGTGFSRVWDLAIDPSNAIWSVGALYLNTDFDPSGSGYVLSSPSGGNANSFFAKYQALAFDTAWATEDRAGGDDYIYDAQYLSNGSILLTGSFEGQVDMDPGPAEFPLEARGSSDIFIGKYSATMQLEWALHFGGTAFEEASQVAEDPAGNIYICGHYLGNLIYPGPNGTDSLVSASQASVFLAKINPQGQVLWMKDIQGLGNEYAYGLSVNSQGKIALGGWMQGSISFNGSSNVPNVSNRAAYLAVYDTAGLYQWHQIVDGASNEYAYACLASESGDFFLAGSYRNTVDFDPGPGSDSYTSNFGGNDVFISKYDATGQYQWVQVLGQNSFEAASGLAEDLNQNIYLTGDFSATQDFDASAASQSLTSNGFTDIFVLSLSNSGQFRWVRQLGGSGGDKPNAIVVKDSLVFHTGYFYNTVDLNPGPDSLLATSLGQNAIYLQVLDTAGAFVDALSLDGSGADIGLTVDHQSGNTLIAGHFENAVDFDPDSTSMQVLRSFGDQDGFLLQLGSPLPCQNIKDSSYVEACENYTWRGTSYFNSGVYRDTSQQADPSCDSIFTLNLLIRSYNNYYYTINGCDSVVFRGLTYLNGGYVVDTLQDQYGCDSIEEFFIYVDSLDRSVITNGFTASAQQSNVQYQWINCDNGNQMVVGATSQNFDPSLFNQPNGNYAVIISSINCSSTSDCVFLQNIGLPQWSLSPPQVYPNPSDGLINIHFGEEDQYRLEFYDSQGRPLTLSIDGDGPLKRRFHLPEIPGIYYLRIHNSADEVWQTALIRR